MAMKGPQKYFAMHGMSQVEGMPFLINLAADAIKEPWKLIKGRQK